MTPRTGAVREVNVDKEGYVAFTKDSPRGQAEGGKVLLWIVGPTSMGFAVKSFFMIDDEIAGINQGSSEVLDAAEEEKEAEIVTVHKNDTQEDLDRRARKGTSSSGPRPSPA